MIKVQDVIQLIISELLIDNHETYVNCCSDEDMQARPWITISDVRELQKHETLSTTETNSNVVHLLMTIIWCIRPEYLHLPKWQWQISMSAQQLLDEQWQSHKASDYIFKSSRTMTCIAIAMQIYGPECSTVIKCIFWCNPHSYIWIQEFGIMDVPSRTWF